MSSSSTPKSILADSTGRRRKSQRRASIQWDEANLEQNEEEKVPRMKINEPKTPYRRDEFSPLTGSGSDDADERLRTPPKQSSFDFDADQITRAALRKRRNEWEDSDEEMEDAAEAAEAEAAEKSDSDVEDSADRAQERQQEREMFRAARKQHYRMQEGRVNLKALLAKRGQEVEQALETHAAVVSELDE